MLARIGLMVVACAAVVSTTIACGRYGPPVRPEPMPPSTAGSAGSSSAEPATRTMPGSAVAPESEEEASTTEEDEPDRERDSVGDSEKGSAAGRAPAPVDEGAGESSR
jgi:hypothetical protein